MNSAQFGSFVAEFQAEAWDLTYLGPFLNLAVPLTEVYGIEFHASGNTDVKNDPWDQTGRPDIKAGELSAVRFSNSIQYSCSAR